MKCIQSRNRSKASSFSSPASIPLGGDYFTALIAQIVARRGDFESALDIVQRITDENLRQCVTQVIYDIAFAPLEDALTGLELGISG